MSDPHVGDKVDILSSMPLEVLDLICEHLPNQKLSWLATQNQKLFKAAAGTYWRRNTSVIGKYSSVQWTPVYSNGKETKQNIWRDGWNSRYDTPDIPAEIPVGSWVKLTSHLSLKENKHTGCDPVAEADVSTEVKDEGLPEEMSYTIQDDYDASNELGEDIENEEFTYDNVHGNTHETPPKSLRFLRFGPIANVSPARRNFYARQIRRFKINTPGWGANYTRLLLAHLPDLKIHGLEELSINLSMRELQHLDAEVKRRQQAPQLLKAEVLKAAFGLIGRKTTKFNLIGTSLYDSNFGFSMRSLIPESSVNIKELDIYRHSDIGFAVAFIEKCPRLTHFTYRYPPRLTNSRLEMRDSLERLMEALSTLEMLDTSEIRDVPLTFAPSRIQGRKVRAKHIYFDGASEQFLDDAVSRMDQTAVQEFKVAIKEPSRGMLRSLAGLTLSSDTSVLRKLVIFRAGYSSRRAPAVHLDFPAHWLVNLAKSHPCLEHLEIAGSYMFYDMSVLTVPVYTAIARSLPKLKFLRLHSDRQTSLGEIDSLIALGQYCPLIEKIEADSKWDVTTDEFFNHPMVQESLHNGVALFPNLHDLLMRGTEPTHMEQAMLQYEASHGLNKIAEDHGVVRLRQMISVVFPELKLLTRYGWNEKWVNADLGRPVKPISGEFWPLEEFITPYFWKQARQWY